MRVWVLLVGLAACEAEEVAVPEVVAAPAPRKARTKPASVAGLARPAAKPCLAEPTGEGLADEGIVSSAGLDGDTVRTVMRGFVGNTLACVPAGTAPNGTLTTEIRVGCDGVVAEVRVSDPGGLPEDLVTCVRETLTYAEFPAHDLPDGYTFTYPVTFTF